MGYRWVEHTAEVELEIEVPTRERVFIDALRALGELIGDGSLGDAVLGDVAIPGDEPASLLVRWLDELVYRAETENLAPEDVEGWSLVRRGSERRYGVIAGARGIWSRA
jgi:SHS2 domain-containing protein